MTEYSGWVKHEHSRKDGFPVKKLIAFFALMAFVLSLSVGVVGCTGDKDKDKKKDEKKEEKKEDEKKKE
jgi:hypothetical protein